MLFENVAIVGVEHVDPPHRVTTAELADQLSDRIRVRTGGPCSLKGGGELGGGHHLHRLGDALDGGDGLDTLFDLSDLCHG